MERNKAVPFPIICVICLLLVPSHLINAMQIPVDWYRETA